MILLSVGHSAKAKGAKNSKYNISEYDICKIVTATTCSLLNNNNINSVILDIKNIYPYRDKKLDIIKEINPDIALEFHLNSEVKKQATYAACFYYGKNSSMRSLGNDILNSLVFGLQKHNWTQKHNIGLPSPGFDTRRFWFVTKPQCSSMILEPMFISNDAQALWLTSRGAPEALGLLIGEGILEWIKRNQNPLLS